MKKLLFTLLMLPYMASAQITINPETGFLHTQGVVEVPGTSYELYKKGLAWFADTYNSTKDVLQLEQEGEKLVGRGSMLTSYAMQKVRVYYNLSIDFKDDKYRYTIDKFIYNGGGGDIPLEQHYKHKGMYKKMFADIDRQANTLIQSLNEYMIKKEEVW
jgi:hypothetical protein